MHSLLSYVSGTPGSTRTISTKSSSMSLVSPVRFKLVSGFFSDEKPNRSINTDETTAYDGRRSSCYPSGDTPEKMQDLPVKCNAPFLSEVRNPLDIPRQPA